MTILYALLVLPVPVLVTTITSLWLNYIVVHLAGNFLLKVTIKMYFYDDEPNAKMHVQIQKMAHFI